MASGTKKRKIVEKNKRVAQGKSRKAEIRKNGTTPTFPIHVKAAE